MIHNYNFGEMTQHYYIPEAAGYGHRADHVLAQPRVLRHTLLRAAVDGGALFVIVKLTP